MFNLVPFTGSRRKMADRNSQLDLIGQLLQFPFPEPQTKTIANTTISGDKQRLGMGIRFPSPLTPPSLDRSDRKCGCVVIHSDADPSNISSQIVNSIRNRFGFIKFRKVMHIDFFRVPFSSPLPSYILKSSNQFFLLGVYRNSGFTSFKSDLNRFVDILKLVIAIWVAVTLQPWLCLWGAALSPVSPNARPGRDNSD